ncbi:helix-turn-helix domain-containing protein [Streptomyces sp. NBC_00151]|uniref:helix-turn-helix domain-containing protein n=1 Tax=Streptomyces sp. NBC_00151 TaxID=2975669 RepID=UPI002DD92AD5|nr:helix-turn-helix domain-containing protein [Streptomyces sp. NBC_00151]WRZ41871.1 helix-turn-helix domain-containing protein [Streptomyces sp. NBC_00151]
MTVSDPRKRDAVLLLAGGASVRRTAAEVGVGEGTVRAWKRRPEFVAAVAEVVALVREGERAGAELVEAVSEVLNRLDGDARGVVTVSIPVGASPRRRRQLLARGIAKALEVGER